MSKPFKEPVFLVQTPFVLNKKLAREAFQMVKDAIAKQKDIIDMKDFEGKAILLVKLANGINKVYHQVRKLHERIDDLEKKL